MGRKAQIDVYMNNEQIKARLAEIQEELKQVKVLRDKAAAEGDIKGFNQLNSSMKALTSEARKLERQTLDVNEVLKNLSSASVNELRGALRLATAEMNSLSRTDPKYAQKKKEVEELKNEVDKATGAQKNQGLSLNGLIGTVGKWVAGLGLAKAALSFTKDVIASTDRTADQLEQTIGGLKSGFDYFKKSLASMDFSNFLTNMEKAIQAGKDYVATLDLIEDRTRAQSMLESEDRQKVAELSITMRDVTKSKEVRIQAAKDILVIEERNAERRKDLANQVLDNELKIASVQSGLSEQRIIELMREQETNKDLIAEANEYLDNLDKANTPKQVIPGYGTMRSQVIYDQEAIQRVKETSPAIKALGDDLARLGKLTKEQYDNIANSYTGVGEANASYAETTSRTQIRLAKLNKGILDESENATKHYTSEVKQDINYKQQLIESEIGIMEDSYQKELAALRAKHDGEVNKLSTTLQTNKKLTTEQREEINQTILNLNQKLANDELKLKDDQLKKELSFQEQLLNVKLDGVKKGSAEEFELQNQLLEAQMQKELLAVTGSEEQKQEMKDAIEKKYDRIRSQNSIDFLMTHSDKQFLLDINLLNENESKKISALKKKFEEGKISKKEYTKELEKIEKQYALDSLKLALDKAEKELAILKASGADITQAEATLAQIRLQIAQGSSTSQDSNQSDKSWGDMEDGERQQVALSIADSTQSAIFDIVRNKQQAAFDHKMSLLEKQRDAELKNEKLTEDQRDKIREKYRKKEAKLKLEQWKKQKAADIIQSIIKGALAVITAMAQNGLWAAIPAGIAVAAETAVIASQKPPEFKGGGFTDQDPDDDQPAGTVHANEFVANAQATRNPSVRKVLNIIDYAQKTGAIRTINLPAVVAGAMYEKKLKAGGYVTSSTASQILPGTNNSDLLQAAFMFKDAVTQLQEKGIKVEADAKLVYQDYKIMKEKDDAAISLTS